MRVKKWNKKQIIRVFFIIVAFCMILELFSFLRANRFRPLSFVKYYYGFLGGDYNEPFRDFIVHRKNFKVVADEVNSFISNTPNFWEEYNHAVSRNDEGLAFIIAGSGGETVTEPVDDWAEVSECLDSFPNPQYHIYVREEYPGYVFFESEISLPTYVYTGGEFPKKLIDDLWEDDPEFVAVLKLAHGWYEYCRYYYY